MNKVWKAAVALVLISGGIWSGSLMNLTAEGAGANQPGTVDDPVVTKSYVDQAIQQAIKGGNSNGEAAGSGSSNGSTGGETSALAKESNQLKIVDVRPGQILIAKAGAEFIVRAGKAVVYSEDSNGVADLTDGKDISNGGEVAANHLLSFPREGRGIQVAEGNKYNLTVMVRGGYTIK